jgi:hypothetical protein
VCDLHFGQVRIGRASPLAALGFKSTV